MRKFNLPDFNEAATSDAEIKHFSKIIDHRTLVTDSEFDNIAALNDKTQSGFHRILENQEAKIYRSVIKGIESNNISKEHKTFKKFSNSQHRLKEIIEDHPSNNEVTHDDDVTLYLDDNIASATKKIQLIKDQAFDTVTNVGADNLNQTTDHQGVDNQNPNAIVQNRYDHSDAIEHHDNIMIAEHNLEQDSQKKDLVSDNISQQEQLAQHNDIVPLQQQQDQILECVGNIKNSLHEFKSQFVSLLGNYREDVITMSYEISSKITECVRDYIPERIVRDFLQQHLALLIDDYAVVIELHPTIKSKVENLIKEELSSASLNNIEFIENSKIEAGDCVIKFAEGKIIKNKELILQELNAILAHYITSTNKQSAA